ncbi:hypothetical protein CARUB_v10010810mg [Capsella rubella]|uniref:Uncharacterized protein n=1 Tax=Capsella rubella TaxID=81985 RepID=R0IJP0_9BRAS|nr:hypothetical protein CARUB_v10010810mg [Capsella rubella]
MVESIKKAHTLDQENGALFFLFRKKIDSHDAIVGMKSSMMITQKGSSSTFTSTTSSSSSLKYELMTTSVETMS